MADEIFENPRLADIYDVFNGSRKDLDHYLAIAKELKAKSVLDVGCGTGCFAGLLIEHGFDVTGVEPAKASLDIARRKRLFTIIYKLTFAFSPCTEQIFFSEYQQISEEGWYFSSAGTNFKRRHQLQAPAPTLST